MAITFSAGLDLVEHHREDRRPEDFMHICLRWHEAFNKMEYGGVPIIAALKGAVVGGGLELASSAHIRVADRNHLFRASRRSARVVHGRWGNHPGRGPGGQGADDRHDADGPGLQRSGSGGRGALSVSCRGLLDGQGARSGARGGRKSALVELCHLLGHQPHAEHVGTGCGLCRSGGGGGGEHPACLKGTAGGLCQQDGGAGERPE